MRTSCGDVNSFFPLLTQSSGNTCHPPFFPLGTSPLFCHHLVFATATLGECPISRHHRFSKHSSARPASSPPYKSDGRLEKGPPPASSASRASSTGPFRFSSADVSFLHMDPDQLLRAATSRVLPRGSLGGSPPQWAPLNVGFPAGAHLLSPVTRFFDSPPRRPQSMSSCQANRSSD